MTEDDTELPFTLFIATAQLLVGIGLIAFATSGAVRIIGGVLIAFALLTGGTAWYHAHRRGQRLFGYGPEETDESEPPGDQAPEPPRAGPPGDQPPESPRAAAGPQPSQGPRQPPNPDASR
jgi:hypothetical protein